MNALHGVRIVVTRAQHQSGALAEMLRERGAEVEEIPTIEIRSPADFAPLDAAVGALHQYDWLLWTSVNGVEAMFRRAAEKKADLVALQQLQICAIGPATRKAVERRGLSVAAMPERYVAESVVETLRERVRGKRVLLVRAAEARDVIPRELSAIAARVDVVPAYQTVVPAGSRERMFNVLRSEASPDVVTFTSSSTARHLIAMLGGAEKAREELQGVALASIGPVTSSTLRQHGLQPEMEAAEFTTAGLVAAIDRWRTNQFRKAR